MMYSKIVSFFSIILCSFTLLLADLFEVQNFKDINTYITPNTLVILDIDDTLLIPKQMLGCDEWFQYRFNKHKSEGMNRADALEKSLAEWEAVRHLTQMEIVESGTETIIQDMQARGYTVMGLTTQGLALATRTYLQLIEQNIDLSVASPIKDDHYIVNHGHGVLYRHGILFTSGSPKGSALFKFCDETGLSPKRIVFINDKTTHLQDIEQVANERGVEFIGLRYAYSDARKAAFRTEVAELQFSLSTFVHLLSDEEAMSILQVLQQLSTY